MTFTYNGEGGNENNFPTKSSCTEACGQWEIPERCLHAPDVGTGPAENAVKMFAYDHAKQKCKKLKYTGEGGNDNRFAAKIDCRKTCKVSSRLMTAQWLNPINEPERHIQSTHRLHLYAWQIELSSTRALSRIS